MFYKAVMQKQIIVSERDENEFSENGGGFTTHPQYCMKKECFYNKYYTEVIVKVRSRPLNPPQGNL